jgi:Domain of unknown function (DUF4159)
VYADLVGSLSKRLTYGVGLACLALAAPRVYAQCNTGTREPTTEVHNAPYDGRFTFARLAYRTGPGGYYYYGLPAWAHGYPASEQSLMKILEGLTGIAKPHMDRTNVIAIGDPEMFNYPLSYMTEAGYLTLTDIEAKALREYLLKGGFVIFDDFRSNRGNDGWGNFVRAMRQVMPEGALVKLDAKNPLFHAFFEINNPDDFVSCYDSRDGLKPEFWGMFEHNDPSRRLLFVANFNNDIAQYWEWSDTGFTPIELSNDAYKFGVNYVMYALTH